MDARTVLPLRLWRRPAAAARPPRELATLRRRRRLTPRRAPRPCPVPGCAAKSERGGRCAKHSHRPDRLRVYDSSAWKRLRSIQLADQPFCEDCLEDGRTTAATDVDHVERVRDRPDLALDSSNLRSLCKPCHSRKTARESGWTPR